MSAITDWSTGASASDRARDSLPSSGRLESCGWRSWMSRSTSEAYRSGPRWNRCSSTARRYDSARWVTMPYSPTAADGLEAASEGEVSVFTVLGAAAKLQPGVTEPLVVLAAEQQVPLHLLLAVAIRLHARWREVGIEQERQGEREHLGLAGAVVAAQH